MADSDFLSATTGFTLGNEQKDLSRLRAVVQEGVKKSPDKEAEKNDWYAKVGMTPTPGEDMDEDVKAMYKTEGILDKVWDKPDTQNFLIGNAGTAHDDVDTLTELEELGKRVRNSLSDISDRDDDNRLFSEVGERDEDLGGDEDERFLGIDLHPLGKFIEDVGEEAIDIGTTPRENPVTDAIVEGVKQSAGAGGESLEATGRAYGNPILEAGKQALSLVGGGAVAAGEGLDFLTGHIADAIISSGAYALDFVQDIEKPTLAKAIDENLDLLLMANVEGAKALTGTKSEEELKKKIKENVLDKVKTGFEHGRLIQKLGYAGAGFRRNFSIDNLRRIQDIEEQIKTLGIPDYKGVVGFFVAVAEVVGQNAESLSRPEARERLLAGAGIGAGAGFAGGPLAPVTVPTGVGAGLASAMLAHTAMEAYIVDGGHSFIDMVKEGVHPDIAVPMSMGVGIINAALETTGNVALAAPIKKAIQRSMKNAMGKALKEKSVQTAAANFVKSYGTSIGVNVATEVIQELVQMAGEDLAKEFAGKEKKEGEKMPVQGTKEEDVEKRLIDIAVKTFKATAVLALPGSAANFLAERKRIRATTETQANVDLIAERIQNSKLLNRDPQGLAVFAQAVIGQRAVRMSADDFNEMMYHGQLEARNFFPTDGLKRQYDEAQANGGDITIPTNLFIEHVMGNKELYGSFKDKVAWGLDRYSAEEAKEMENQILDMGFDDAYATKPDPVKEETADQADQDAAQEESTAETVTEELNDVDIARINSEVEALIMETDQTIAKSQEESTLEFIRNEDPMLMSVEESLGLQGLFKSAEDAGMTPQEYEGYLTDLTKAQEDRKINKETKAQKRKLKQVEQEIKTERDAIQQDTREQVQHEPVYAAMETTRGDSYNPSIKLDQEEVIVHLQDLDITNPEEIKKEIRQLRAKGVGIATQQETDTGQHQGNAALIASIHNFDSVGEMLDDMRAANHLEKEVDARTMKALEESRPDLFGQKAEIQDAIDAVINSRDNVLQKELNALKEPGQRQENMAWLRAAARRNIRDHPVRDVTVHKYLSQVAKQGKRAGVALRKGDRPQAYEHKKNQALLLQYTREAQVARENIKKDLKAVRQVRKNREAKKPLPPQFEEAIDLMLAAVNLGPSTPKTEAGMKNLDGMKDAYKKLREQGAPIEMPVIANWDNLQNYKDMSYGDFHDYANAIRQLQKAGRDTWNRLNDHRSSQTASVVNDIVEGVHNNTKQRRSIPGTDTEHSRFRRYARELGLAMRDAVSTIALLDGGNYQGKIYQGLFKPIDEAVTRGYGLDTNIGINNREKAQAVQIKALQDMFTPGERSRMNRETITLPAFPRKLTRNEQLSILLNLGNEDNKQALIDSGQYSQDQLDSVLWNASKRDMDFAQGVWDMLDSYWDEIKTATQKRHGYTPTKVEATPLDTEHGKYKGGYYPLRRETEGTLVESVVDFDEAANDIRFGRPTQSHTAHGHAKDRKENVTRPVIMDLHVFKGHLKQVAYDLEMGDAARQAYEIIEDPRVKEAFRIKGQSEMWQDLSSWVDDTISGSAHKAGVGNKVLRWTRSSTTFGAIGWNIGVALQQPLGLTHTLEVAGTTNTVWGMAKYLGAGGSFGGTAKRIASVSPAFNQRMENFNASIQESERQMQELKIPVLSRMTPDAFKRVVQRSFFYPLRKLQQMADTISWLAGYRQATKQGKTGQDAIDHADFVVTRAQTGPDPHQRPGVERGTIGKDRQQEWAKSFTALMAIFLRKNNLFIDKYNKTNFKSMKDIMGLITTASKVFVLEALLLYHMYGEGGDTDGEEGLSPTDIAAAVGKMAASGVFGIREIAGETQGFRGGGTVGSITKDLARFGVQVGQGEADGAFWRSLNTMVSKLTHAYPDKQINKMLYAGEKALDGENVTLGDFMFGYKKDKKRGISDEIDLTNIIN